jgi:uncharacterized protein (DUF2384 family)
MPQLHPVSPNSPGIAPNFSAEEIRAMQRATVNLFERWRLTDEEASRLLGDISIRTYQRWKSGSFGRAGIDLAERMSNLLGIHKALRLLFREPARGYGWISRPNADFDGRSALDVMLQGRITDLMRVRRYLDAWRGQW